MKTKKRVTGRTVLSLTISAALALSSLPVAGVQVTKAAEGGAVKESGVQAEPRSNDEGGGVTASGTFGGEKDSTGAEITPDTHQWAFAADTGTLTISGEGVIPDYTSSTYTGLPWYGYKDEIKKIVFAGNVTKVGGYLFYNYANVEEVDFSAAEKLTEIGGSSFRGTTMLGTLTGADKLVTLGTNCFYSSGLKTVSLPQVEAVPEAAFRACKSLTAVHFQVATVFGKQAFHQCSVLTEVDAPKVESMGNGVFNACTALESIELPELLSITDGYAFYGCSKLQTISFPKLSTMNGSSAFENCVLLETVDLPSLTSLTNALKFLSGCTSLTSVNIPNAVFKDAANIFNNCSSLVYVDISSAQTLSSNTIFANCTSLKRIYLKGTQLTSTLSSTFKNSLATKPDIYHLNTDEITDKMSYYVNAQAVETEEEFAALKGKETTLHLTQENYDIESPVEPKLTGNAQGAAVTYAYYKDLACLTPVNSKNPSEKPTVAGDYYVRAKAEATDAAFETTSNSVSFRIYGDIPGTGYTYHNGKNTLTITDASVMDATYASSGAGVAPWYQYRSELENVVVGEGVTLTKIATRAFYNLTKMKNFDLPDTVTSIGEYAFSGCRAWEAENVLTAQVTSIGKNAFESCGKLTGTMTLGESITEIPNLLFYNCAGITQILYDADKVTSFGDRCFYGTGVTELVFPSGITEIPADFFSNCEKLSNVTILASVTALGTRCFLGCKGLEKITIPDGVKMIGDNCFSNSGITSIKIPDTVETIGSNVFSGAESLETFEIPKTMTTFPEGLLKGTGLKKFIVPATVTQIGKGALQGLSQLEYLEFEKEDYADDTFAGVECVDRVDGVSIKYDSTFGGVPQTAMIVCDGATYDLLAARGTYRKDASNGWLAEEILYKRSELLSGLETTFNTMKEEAGRLNESDYDREIWNAFQTTLAEAEALFSQGDTTYDRIQNRMAATESVSAAAKGFLRATYQNTAGILESDYDTDGEGADAWFAYLDERDAAMQVLQNGDVTFAQIIEADKNLRQAMADIVLLPVDGAKADFESFLQQETGALKEGDYTAESWKALQDAIKEAKEISQAATKISDVGAGRKKVEDALAALVRVSTENPTVAPSTEPSTSPSTLPSTKPSMSPSTKPSASPSTSPSTEPTKVPGIQPTKNPGGSLATKKPEGTTKSQKVSVKKATLKKATSKKKKTIVVQWKKLAGVTGYQIQIGTNKKVTKGKKTYTVKKAKTVKKTIKKLRRKKTYYVRVRGYKTSGGKKYYGKWSSVKKVKVK